MIEVDAYTASFVEFVFICGLIAVTGLAARKIWKKAIKIEQEELNE